MFYKPKFCCECGEKIERIDWKLWTNRRFCEVCAAEQKLNDILPKAGIAVCLLLGLFGLGSFLQSRPEREPPVIQRNVVSARPSPPAASNVGATPNPIGQSQPYGRPGDKVVNSESLPGPQTNGSGSVNAPLYMCGARTKKGTPCTRRVKGNVRCWQHVGMPAMLPPEKLVISR